MSTKQYRRLDVGVERQPLVDQRPWLIAGVILAIIVLLMSMVAYINKAETADAKSISTGNRLID